MTGTRGYLGQISSTFWLNLAAIWHVLVSLASLMGIYMTWHRPTLPSWLLLFSTCLFLSTTIISGSAAFLITRRQHLGRTLSLSLNYLGMVGCSISAAHTLGVFMGIDSLATTFGRGMPFLFTLFMGYGVHIGGERYEAFPLKRNRFQQAGRVIMWASIACFFVAIDTPTGLMALAQQYSHPLPMGLTLGALAFGGMFWLMRQQPLAEAMYAKLSSQDILTSYLFLSPNLLGFLIFFGGPLLFSFYLSFTDADIFGAKSWVGLDNYRHIIGLTVVSLTSPNQRATEILNVKLYDELNRFQLFGQIYLLGAQDKLFWLSLRNTFLFVTMAVPLSVIPSFVLANILNSKLRGMAIYRAIYFIPSIAVTVGIALIWQQLYKPANGYINYIILLGISLFNTIFNEATPDPQIHWLTDSRTSLISLVIIFAWQNIGFNTILFLGGLQNIPKQLYEAAMIDGANQEQQFRFITLPLLIPTLVLVLTTTIFQAMQLFEQGFILMNPYGGPNYSALTMTLYLYQIGFQRFDFGYASALAWIVFALIFGCTFLLMVSFYGLDGKPSWGEE